MVKNLWVIYKASILKNGVSPEEVEKHKETFYTGASMLFEFMVKMLDSDREPTEDDMKKMDLLDQELQEFNREFEKKHIPKH